MAHGFQLPPGFEAAQAVTMTPMNDIQVVALVAATIWPAFQGLMVNAEEMAVDVAINLLAESVLRAKTGRLMARVRELEALRAVPMDG